MSRAGDRGTAVAEFVLLGMVLLVPLMYVVLAASAVQRSLYGVTHAAREAGRAYGTGTAETAAARAEYAARLALADQGVDPAGLQVRYAAADTDCAEATTRPWPLTPGAIFAVCVTRPLTVPAVPGFLAGQHNTVTGRHIVHADRYRDLGHSGDLDPGSGARPVRPGPRPPRPKPRPASGPGSPLCRDGGTTIPLLLLAFLVAGTFATASVAASAAFLAQRDLAGLCDGAAVAAANAVDRAALDSGGDSLRLDPAAVADTVAAYRQQAGPDAVLRARTDGWTVTVTCTRTVHIPFGAVLGRSDGLDRTAVASARSPLLLGN